MRAATVHAHAHARRMCAQPPRIRYPDLLALVNEPLAAVTPDVEGDAVAFSEDAEHVLPAGLVVDAKTGAIWGVPTEPFSGTAVVVVSHAGPGGAVQVEVPVEVYLLDEVSF